MATNVNTLEHEELKASYEKRTSEAGTTNSDVQAQGYKQTLFTIGETALYVMVLNYKE